MTEADKLLTVEEIAQHLNVTVSTVQTWLRRGQLKGFKLPSKAGWRVGETDYRQFIEQKKNIAAA